VLSRNNILTEQTEELEDKKLRYIRYWLVLLTIAQIVNFILRLSEYGSEESWHVVFIIVLGICTFCSICSLIMSCVWSLRSIQIGLLLSQVMWYIMMFQFRDILSKLEFDYLVDRVTQTATSFATCLITQIFIGNICVEHKRKLDLLNIIIVFLALLNRLLGLDNLWERRDHLMHFGLLIILVLTFAWIQNNLEKIRLYGIILVD